MKALSKAQKIFFYEQCVYGRLRWLAKPCYDLVLSSQLLINRLFDYFSSKDNSDLSELTLLIKTFERPYAVKRLVKSIKRHYPVVKIVVIDDSRKPLTISGVKMVHLPYDSGASVGRNTALEQIMTKYFLLLDDDFVFSRRQNLGALVEQMERYPNIDILGGRVIDLPLYIVHNFQDMPLNNKSLAESKLGTVYGENTIVKKTTNFFIAKTNSVKKVKWNETLKTEEHSEFFNRAYGVLTTAYRPTMLILHAKTPFDRAYLVKRYRYARSQVIKN